MGCFTEIGILKKTKTRLLVKKILSSFLAFLVPEGLPEEGEENQEQDAEKVQDLGKIWVIIKKNHVNTWGITRGSEGKLGTGR